LIYGEKNKNKCYCTFSELEERNSSQNLLKSDSNSFFPLSTREGMLRWKTWRNFAACDLLETL